MDFSDSVAITVTERRYMRRISWGRALGRLALAELRIAQPERAAASRPREHRARRSQQRSASAGIPIQNRHLI